MACEHGITGPCSVCEVVRLEAEVARLREERQELVERHGELVERALFAEADIATERAAHEATKAELEELSEKLGVLRALYDKALREELAAVRKRTETAEQRVAELKRELVEQELRHVRTREERTALSSARELLENANQGRLWYERRDAWLRAHPEPATPAAEYHASGDVPAAVLSAVQAAYPAATGALCDFEGCGPRAAKEAKGG